MAISSRELNELFIKDFDYFFMKYTTGPIKDYSTLSILFSDHDIYDIFMSYEMNPRAITAISKEILYRLVLHDIPIKNGSNFLLKLIGFLKTFWRKVNYVDYTFKLTTIENSKLILSAYEKDNNKGIFLIDNQASIKNFIINIISIIDNCENSEDYKEFTIKDSGTNIDKEYNIILNITKMKKLIMDYSKAIAEIK